MKNKMRADKSYKDQELVYAVSDESNIRRFERYGFKSCPFTKRHVEGFFRSL